MSDIQCLQAIDLPAKGQPGRLFPPLELPFLRCTGKSDFKIILFHFGTSRIERC